MTVYRDWLNDRMEEAMQNFFNQRGFYPTWPNEPRARMESIPTPEPRKPFDRHRIVHTALWQAERDLACSTEWIAQCDSPAYPLAITNLGVFLDLQESANTRYDQALWLWVKLPTPPQPLGQMDLF